MSLAAQPANRSPRPFRLTMLIPTLVVSVVLPIAILKTLERFGVSPIWALAAGCVPPLLNNLRLWMTSRRLDPVGILMMASIGSGVAASLVSGDIASRIVTDCLLNGAWGLAFLGSLAFWRPAMFFIIRPLVAAEDASRTEIWNGLWRYPLFRRALRLITAAWGVVYFAEVLSEAGLARVLRPETVVTLAPLVNAGATLGLIVLTRQGMRAMRQRLERQEHLIWPL
jgi:hypothetical protein